jgi:hypothetical protein
MHAATPTDLRAPLLTALTALLTLAASAPAIAQPRPPRPTWIERPLVTEHARLDVSAGLGFAVYGYLGRRNGSLNRGAGTHLEITMGLFDRLELGAGVGVRFSDNGAARGADRFARVNREWLPTPASLGQGLVTSPYVRARVALLPTGIVQLGVEGNVAPPLAGGTCLAGGLGAPVHLLLARRVRLETGVFHEFVCVVPSSSEAVRFSFFQLPLRVNVQLTPAAWVGLRTGFEVVDYRVTNAGLVYVPLGVQGGYRVTPRLDVVANVVFPELVHYDDALGDHVLLRAFGAGVAVVYRAR